ncbi:hypothetical protein [Mesorhizobium sp. M1405]|uniref:hypothetical protein n=1 Tax=Mesorhizobium sp. M1405 TaxID=2957098 RepID=UPI003338F4E4
MTMRPSGNFGNGMFDAAGELGDPDNEAFENSGDGAGEFTLGLGLGFGGCCAGSGAQPAEHIGDAAPAAILVLGEEGGHALLGQAAGALPRRVALDEPQRDRACDVGEQAGGSWPEAVEQGTLLVGEHKLAGTRSSRPRTSRGQGLDGVGLWPERRQPMAVGPQDVGKDVGKDVGIAGSLLAATAR